MSEVNEKYTVARLRRMADVKTSALYSQRMALHDAADLIERLRAENAKLTVACATYEVEAAGLREQVTKTPEMMSVPQDVINLVIAAREAFDTGTLPDEENRALDKALEAFSSRVPYENQPDDGDQDACVVCGEHLEIGDAVYWSSNDDGHMHADCATSYVDEDGKETSEPPEPMVFRSTHAPAPKLMVALTKINDIRNSIIGCQTVNWSEHIYPLVAALEEAGIEGAGYPASRANVGTMLERTLAAENEASVFRAALEAIINPIAAMQRRAKAEGAKLDGMMANILASDPDYLKGIARAALVTSEGSDNG